MLLFPSVVYMIPSRGYVCVIIVLIVTIFKANARYSQLNKKNDSGAEALTPDFMNFVHGLDSMVFKSERKRNSAEVKQIRSSDYQANRRLPKRPNFNDKIKASQTAAIRDILMLKLVSYYEDKYNVGRTKIYTPPDADVVNTQPEKNSVNYDSMEETPQSHKTKKTSAIPRHEKNSPEFNDIKHSVEEVVTL